MRTVHSGTVSGAVKDELILTVLSQHTSDTNRDRAYADLRRRFPRWDDVATAPLPAIARAIRRGGLGPTKAVRIRAMLRAVRDEGVALDAAAFTGMADVELWEKLVALPGVLRCQGDTGADGNGPHLAEIKSRDPFDDRARRRQRFPGLRSWQEHGELVPAEPKCFAALAEARRDL